jgi:hypothetical protein
LRGATDTGLMLQDVGRTLSYDRRHLSSFTRLKVCVVPNLSDAKMLRLLHQRLANVPLHSQPMGAK